MVSQGPVTRSQSTSGTPLYMVLQAIYDIFAHPYHLDIRSAIIEHPTDPVEQIEQKRRSWLLRLIISSYLIIVLPIALLLPIIARQSPFLEWSDIVLIAVGFGCLALSYTRLTIATLLFLFLLLGACFMLVHYEAGGLNERTVLIYSFIAVLIFMAGMLLSGILVWIVVTLMVVPTIFSLVMMPLRTPDPRALAMGSLAGLYIFAIMLTWLSIRSTTVGMRCLAVAHRQEHALSEQKDAFINIASHELRTPLTPILLDCKLIERYIRQPDRAEQVIALTASMIKNVKRMDSMIGMLLDTSQLSLERFVLQKKTCDIAQLIRETVEEQQQQWERPVQLQGTDVPIIGDVDAKRIWQVMTNIVGNALKYSPPSAEVKVNVMLHPRGPQRILQAAISDTGPGIPQQAIPHVFERNYQVSGLSADHPGGLGLGLYISASIIKLHGGTIWVESEPGHGSVFTFEIPIDKDERE